jgi:hypothetical protein
MAEHFDLYADGKRIATLDRDQVAEIEQLLFLRGIVLAPAGVSVVGEITTDRVGELH